MGPWYSGEELSLAKPLLRSLGCSSLLSHRAALPAMDTYPGRHALSGHLWCSSLSCHRAALPAMYDYSRLGRRFWENLTLWPERIRGNRVREKNFLGSVVRCTARGSARGVDGGTDIR